MDLPGLLGLPDARGVRAVSVLKAAQAYGEKASQREKRQTRLTTLSFELSINFSR
jgi:hypothetical protein